MRVLRMGSEGPAVELLQLALDRAGFGPLETDGRFGPATEEALRAFQRGEGLTADGIAGTLTNRALLPWIVGFRVHTVRAGDSFWSLAREFDTTPEAIALANPDARAENLTPGERLVIPLDFPVVPTTIRWSSALVGYCVRGLAARYPFLRPGEIGRSVLGRPLWSLRLGAGERRVLCNAAHHANEWICTPLLLRFTEELCAAFAAGGQLLGQSAAKLLSEAALLLVPALNPDGIDLVTGELRRGEAFQTARRIAADYPRYPFPEGWKANIRGVDLNLQYPAGWDIARENKAALGVISPAPADFVGPRPLSAPESRALYDATLAFSPDLTLSFHTQGAVIYWRYCGRAPEGAKELGEEFARLSGYALDDAPFASGFAGYRDWFVESFDRPGFTIEAGQGKNPLPLADFDAIYRENLPILVAAMSVE